MERHERFLQTSFPLNQPAPRPRQRCNTTLNDLIDIQTTHDIYVTLIYTVVAGELFIPYPKSQKRSFVSKLG